MDEKAAASLELERKRRQKRERRRLSMPKGQTPPPQAELPTTPEMRRRSTGKGPKPDGSPRALRDDETVYTKPPLSKRIKKNRKK